MPQTAQRLWSAVTDNYTNTMTARYSDNEFDARLVPGGDVAEHLIDQMGTVKAMWEKRVASLRLAANCILYIQPYGNIRYHSIITPRHKAHTHSHSERHIVQRSEKAFGNSKENTYILNVAHSSRLRLYLVNMWQKKYCKVHLFRRILTPLTKSAHTIFAGESERTTSLERSRRISEDNIKTGITEIYNMNKHNGWVDHK